MNQILNILKEKDITILLGVALTLIILIVIISIIEKKRKDKVNITTFENVVIEPETITIEEKKVEVEKIENVNTPEILEIEVLDEEPIHFEEETIQMINEEELERTQAKIELERVYDVLKEAQNKKDDILEDTITKFELEQEESAIISYDELKKVSEDLYKKNELLYESEEDAPLTIEDLRSKFEVDTLTKEKTALEEFIKTMDKEEVEELEVEYKKFDPMPFISPVYGFDIKVINPCVDMELENTANLEKLEREIRKTSEYSQSLKEIEKNVD